MRRVCKSIFTSIVMVVFLGGVVLAAPPVRIGVIQPLTGQGAYVGTNIMDGMYLAQEMVNSAGGILGGRKIELIVEDDQCIPIQAVASMKKLIYQDKLKVVLAEMCSSATVAAVPIAKKGGIIHVVPISYAPKITEEMGHPNLFRTSTNSNIITDGFAMFIAKKLGLKTIGILSVNDDFGRDQVAAFTKRFEEVGRPKVIGTYYFDFKDRDFSTVLTKIKASKAEGMYIVARTPQNAMILNQMGDFGMTGKIVVTGSTNFSTAACRDQAGKNAEGLHSAVTWDTAIKTPPSISFMYAYKKKYGKLPDQEFCCSGYTGLMIAVDAIRRAGTDQDIEKIREAFKATDWDGPAGNFRFDEKGQATVPCHVIKVIKGKPVLVQ